MLQPQDTLQLVLEVEPEEQRSFYPVRERCPWTHWNQEDTKAIP